MGNTLPADAVIFSLPDSSVFYKADLISGEPARGKFVVRPFVQQAEPLIFDMAEATEVDPSEWRVELPEATTSENVDRGTYIENVEQARESVAAYQGKVVLSRRVEVPWKNIKTGNSLVSLRQQYPKAFVYLLNSSQFGVWMGASPEMLIKKRSGLYSTMALAGTRWGDELFEQKEFEEQMAVTRYLLQKLEDTVVEVSDIYEDHYGPLRHLRTDFNWEDERDVLEFAERLHPTPAVCGFPASRAMEYIFDNEGYDRSLYTGYLGWIESNESAQLFVNLRCLQLFRDRAWVYVGGGINAMSDPVQEWEETERKKDSILSALHNE